MQNCLEMGQSFDFLRQLSIHKFIKEAQRQVKIASRTANLNLINESLKIMTELLQKVSCREEDVMNDQGRLQSLAKCGLPKAESL